MCFNEGFPESLPHIIYKMASAACYDYSVSSLKVELSALWKLANFFGAVLASDHM